MSIDTHKAVKALMVAGFNEAQAEAIVETRHSDLATKTDLQAQGQSLRADMQTMEQSLRVDIQTLEQATKTEFQAIRAEMRELELRLTGRMGAMLFAASGLVVAVLKLSP